MFLNFFNLLTSDNVYHFIYFFLNQDHSIWVENLVNEVGRKISSAGPTLPLSPPETPSDVTEKVINGESGGVDPKLIHLKAENNSLQAQINHYKTVLDETVS